VTHATIRSTVGPDGLTAGGNSHWLLGGGGDSDVEPGGTDIPTIHADTFGSIDDGRYVASAFRGPRPDIESDSDADAGCRLVPVAPCRRPSVAGALPVDSFVRSIDLVPVSGSPGAEPYRFDTGDPDPSTHPFVRYPKGALLVVLRGPVMVDGRAWYYLTPAHIAIDLPTGWAPVASPTGAPYYQPTPFDCPVSPIAIEDLSSLNGFSDGLPVCYGDDEVTIVGDVVACERGPDAFAQGATWLADGSCRFESPPTIRGLDPSLEPGRYAVTGRFLDDEARSCRKLDAVDSPEERIAAVLYCRSAFVATSAVPVSD
jgi:hypothetical protein